jgi:hypothetical protein
LAATKLPLTTWLLAMFLLTPQKNGISALELKRHLGVSYLTAWRVKHKLLQVMKEQDNQTPLSGVIEVDDAYWGGERHGAKSGRGSPNKVPFIAALPCDEDGHPIGLRLGKVAGFRKTEVERFAKRHLDLNAIVLTDGLACFTGIASAGFEHQPVVTGGGYRRMAIPEFPWLNAVLGNVKNSPQGSYHPQGADGVEVGGGDGTAAVGEDRAVHGAQDTGTRAGTQVRPPQAATARHTGAPAAAVRSPPASNTASSWAARTWPPWPVGQCRKCPYNRRF